MFLARGTLKLFRGFSSEAIDHIQAQAKKKAHISSAQHHITKITTDRDGRTHFADLDLPLTKGYGKVGLLSEALKVAGDGVYLRETPGDYDFSWHCAPTEQFIVNLDASVEVEVSSGAKKVFEKGEMFYVEDISGDGHFSRAVDGKARRSMFIPVARTIVESLALQPMISKIDIRVGEIINVERHPDADRLYCQVPQPALIQ